MKHSDIRAFKLQGFILRVSIYIEILIGFIVIGAILIEMTKVPGELRDLFLKGGFSDFLTTTFDIIIGVELLKMLCRIALDSVVEVLLITVARSIIIEHLSMYQTLVGILAIAVLFVIRKFLFVSALDKKEEEQP